MVINREDIPAGYQLHVETWENDADSYAVKVLPGLTIDDVKFYIDVITKFYSASNGGREKYGYMGNAGNTEQDLDNHIQKCLNDHPAISMETRRIWTELVTKEFSDESMFDDTHQALCDLLLHHAFEEIYRYDYNHFCRALGSFEVFHCPAVTKRCTDRFEYAGHQR